MLLKHPTKMRTERIDVIIEALGDAADALRQKDARDLSLVAYQLRDGDNTQYDIIGAIELIENALDDVKIIVENYRAGRAA